MFGIYIPASTIANPPTRKVWRLLRAQFPAMHTRTVSMGRPFKTADGTNRLAGLELLSDDEQTAEDRAAIVALVTTHDGSKDRKPFGLPIPMVATEEDLPSNGRAGGPRVALLAMVAEPMGLWAFVGGEWLPLA